MPLIDVPDAQLWYDDSGGDGPPVVFVHPAAASSACWEHQLPAFTAAGFRCITYDLRGWGRSKPSPETAGSGYLSDDLEALRERLGLDRIALVAAAYGGFGSVDYALRFQDRLRALVLATTQGGIVDPDYLATLDRIVTPELRGLPIELRELGPSYRAESPEDVARWLQIIHDAGGERATRQGRRLELSLASLEALRVPTLLLAAGADLLAPPAMMRRIAARIPGSEFVVIGEAGHSAHWERPAEWNQLVLDFLRRY